MSNSFDKSPFPTTVFIFNLNFLSSKDFLKANEIAFSNQKHAKEKDTTSSTEQFNNDHLQLRRLFIYPIKTEVIMKSFFFSTNLS